MTDPLGLRPAAVRTYEPRADWHSPFFLHFAGNGKSVIRYCARKIALYAGFLTHEVPQLFEDDELKVDEALDFVSSRRELIFQCDYVVWKKHPSWLNYTQRYETFYSGL